MSKPFMEHPDGTLDCAADAIADAVKRLRELPTWNDWITFCAQGYGGRPDTYHFEEIKMRRDKIGSELLLPPSAEQFDIAGASPAAVAAFLDELFRKHMGVQPFPDEGDDYAIWEQSGSRKPLRYEDTIIANQTLETNCRPAAPRHARWQFGSAVHARPCLSGGSRSAFRWAGESLCDIQ